MSLSQDYQPTLLPNLGHIMFLPQLSNLRAPASSILSSFFILLGIIFPIPLVWLRSASGLIVACYFRANSFVILRIGLACHSL
jgi:hypothetical protein